MYGSSGVAAGTTNSWPVILRWMVSAASPDSSMTSIFARRPTASIRAPDHGVRERLEAVCVLSVRAQEERTPTMVAPTRRGRRSRATVSTSGSSGIGRTYEWTTGAARGTGSHRLPVVAGLDVDGQRDVQRDRPFHRLADHRDERVDAVARDLEQQLVVDLEEHPRRRAGRPPAARRPGSWRSS